MYLGLTYRCSARIYLAYDTMCIKNMHSIWYYGIFKALLNHITLSVCLSVCPCLSPRVTLSQSHTPAILQTTLQL